MMATCTLLVDFGSSRVKCALWSHTEQVVLAQKECAGPPTEPVGQEQKVEIPADLYWQALEATAGTILREIGHQHDIDGLWLCTEMHGILVLPDTDGAGVDTGQQATYISWRDGRAMQAIDGESTYERLSTPTIAAEFFALSGMKLKAGLPFLTLAHLQRADQLPNAMRLCTLADWLLWRGGECNPGIHPSLAAGTGLYDLEKQQWSPHLLQLAGLNPQLVRLPRVLSAGQNLGQITLGGRKISLFGALGDMHSASFGAGFPMQAGMMVNLGTGSQVLCQTDVAFGLAANVPNIERRPGILQGQFAAITHIPCGRALNVFAKFFDDCALAANGEPFFWRRFANLTVAQVLAACEDIDLNVFAAAWRYQAGGCIKHIHEGAFSLDTMLPALAKSWLMQYAHAISLLDPARQHPRFLLAGGLCRRAAFILPVLEALTGRTGQSTASLTGEETLDGLLSLAGRHVA
jgi:hypothetical protein